jgi:cache domain-containing protein
MFRGRKNTAVRHRSTIKRRLMAWGLALLGAALVINTLAGSVYTRRQIEDSAGRLQMEVATRTARRIQNFIDVKIERLQDAAVAMSLYPMGSMEQKLLGTLLIKNDRSFDEFAILNDRGEELLKVAEKQIYVSSDFRNESQSAAFRSAIKADHYISTVRTSNQAEPYVTMGVPIKSGPRQVVGALIVSANLKFLWDVIGAGTFGTAGYSYIIDERGKLIAHRDPSLVLRGLELHQIPKIERLLRSHSRIRSRPKKDRVLRESASSVLMHDCRSWVGQSS